MLGSSGLGRIAIGLRYILEPNKQMLGRTALSSSELDSAIVHCLMTYYYYELKYHRQTLDTDELLVEAVH